MKAIKFILALAIIVSGSLLYAQSYTVDVDNTTIKWLGKKVTGEHFGEIKLKSGSLEVNDGMIASGEFVMDMNSMTCDDIEDEAYNEKLIGHLMSDDFFGVKTYPTAKLVISKASKFDHGKAKVEGKLTIKDKTNPISFEVMMTGEKYTAKITIDRSKYDVRYGSKSFFDNLGDKVIYDDFTLDVEMMVK